MSDLIRCGWDGSELMTRYHDEEWGTPLHDERALFELLILEGAQAGLSWETILRKREGYRAAFDSFDPAIIAAYTDSKVEALLADPGIVRNRAKVRATIQNAAALLRLRSEGETLDHLAWQVVGGRPRRNAWRSLSDLPAKTPESDALSKELQRCGFAFVGSTICYAFMQSAGLVNDHTVDCFRYVELAGA